MSFKTYTISIDEGTGVPMDELTGRLHEAGFVVTQRLDAIGVIVGRGEEAELPRFREIRGVAAIEEEKTYDVRSTK